MQKYIFVFFLIIDLFVINKNPDFGEEKTNLIVLFWYVHKTTTKKGSIIHQ